MTAPSAGQAAAVWVSVLPDMQNFGRELIRGAQDAGGRAGQGAGQEMESSFSKAAKGVAIAGAAVGAALGVAVVGAMNIEAANDKLAAQLGLTGAEAERYGRLAGDLYSANYGDSLETVNEALRQVTLNVGATATGSDAELQRITASVLDVATAFDQDLGGTTAAVGQLMKTGLAPDATSALNIITAGFQTGVDKSGDFLDTLNEYSGQFAKLGLDGATATGILSQGLQGGARDADQVADSLKEFAIRAVDGSTTTAEGFRMLGLDGAEMARRIAAGGPEATGALQMVTDQMRALPDPLLRSQAAAALFGTQSEDMAAALLTIDPSSATAGLGDLNNRVADLGTTLNDNAAGAIESFRRQAVDAFINILGGAVLPAVTALATFLAVNFGPALVAVGGFLTGTVAPALQSFGQWLYDARIPIGIVAGLITAIFLPSLIALAVQSTITAVTTAASWLATQAGAIGAAAIHSVSIGLQVAGWVALRVASLASAIGVAAAWLLAIGPIGLVIAAVVGLVALVIANWDTVRSVTQAVFGWIGSFIGQVWAAITGFFTSGITMVSGAWTGFWSGVQSVVTTVWNAISTFIATVWASITAGFSTATAFLRSLWDSWWAGISTVASTVWGFIRGYIDTVWQIIKGIFTAGTALLRGDWEGFWAALRSIADTVFGGIRTFIDTVWNAIRGFFTSGTSSISTMWGGFWAGLSAVTSTVFGAIRGTVDTVIGAIIAAFRFVVDQIGGIWGGIRRLLAAPINFMINTVYNNGIVRAWNFVAGLIPGIGPIGTIPGIPEFASGGPVMEDTLLRAGEAGPEYILSADAVAGLGGIDAVDKLHRQAVREPIELSTLNSGRWVEGADHDGPGISSSGFGGVKPHVARAGHYLKNRFGISSVGGVGQRANASDHPRGLALDFMTYRDTAKGDALVNYLLPNAGHFAVKYIIWKQRINSGSGWRGMEDRGSVTANHFDHPHVSFLDGPGGGGGFSGEGGGFLNPLPGLVRAFFDTFVNPLVAAIPGGPPRFLDIPKGAVGFARDQALNFFLGLVGGGSDPMDRGGMAFGKGLMLKDTIDPERVLSPRQTVAFERLVGLLGSAPFAAGIGPALPTAVPESGGLTKQQGDRLIELLEQSGRGASITVEDRSGVPVETARSVQLALRMARA